MTIEGGRQFGAWAVRTSLGRTAVAFCRFIPNGMFRQQMILDVVTGELNRATWADHIFFADLPPRSAWEIRAAQSPATDRSAT